MEGEGERECIDAKARRSAAQKRHVLPRAPPSVRLPPSRARPAPLGHKKKKKKTFSTCFVYQLQAAAAAGSRPLTAHFVDGASAVLSFAALSAASAATAAPLVSSSPEGLSNHNRTVGSSVRPEDAIMFRVGWHATPRTTPWSSGGGGGGQRKRGDRGGKELAKEKRARSAGPLRLRRTGVALEHLDNLLRLQVPDVDAVILAAADHVLEEAEEV